MKTDSILEIKNLNVEYKTRKLTFAGKKEYFSAVDNFSLTLEKGRITGLAGESGSGKSTVAKAVAGILKFNNPEVKISGNIIYNNDIGMHDILNISENEMKKLRNKIQMIFQDPYSSLNPRMAVGKIIEEPLNYSGRMSSSHKRDRVLYMMEKTGLQKSIYTRHPHELSGGQRQRISIARALAGGPDILIADEPLSALDVSVQAQIINLLQDLKDEFKLTVLLIAHDLSVIEHLCDSVAVMYLGRIAERGDRESVFGNPAHPYTRALLSSIPSVDATKKLTVQVTGEIPSSFEKPSGCVFRTRCPFAYIDCAEIIPPLKPVTGGHSAACLLG